LSYRATYENRSASPASAATTVVHNLFGFGRAGIQHDDGVSFSCRTQDASPLLSRLEKLCRDYWYPLYSLSAAGYSPHDAQDMTQGFSKRSRQKLSGRRRPTKGKFRSFSSRAEHFVPIWRRAQAQKLAGFK